MKLEEARKLATPGPLYVGERGEWGPYLRSDKCAVAECHLPEDAALLAHAFNMLPELVEALEAYVEADWQASGENAGVYGRHKLEELEKLIATAKEVPGV